ncbi:hypothetical protein P4S73_01225 [Paraglaciecola sp. Hal342]|jgi:hypothetical protein
MEESEGAYKIIFKGELFSADGKVADKTVIAPKLARFLNIPVEKSDLLFSGKTFKLRGKLTLEQAKLLSSKFEAFGLQVDVIDEVSIAADITKQSKVEPKKSEEAKPLTSDRDETTYVDIPPRWKDIVNQLAEIETNLSEARQSSTVALLAECNSQKLKSIVFSFPALVFGIFYYFYLGIFKRGFVLLALTNFLMILIWTFIEIAGLEVKPTHLLISQNVLFSCFAKVDYYQVKVRKRNIYRSFYLLSNSWLLSVFVISSLWISILAYLGLESIS